VHYLLDIKLDHKQSQRSSGGIEAIEANIIVACGLQWLGVESHKTNADAFHISIASSKRVVTQFINALNECNLLSINLPTEDELEDLAIRTTEKSTCDASFYGCVLMIDGFLATRIKPGNHECKAQADFYSGHKKTYGINVQALCDHKLRFRYVCVAAPGKTNDNKAFYQCTGIQTWLQALPTQYFIVGDNAYPLSNKLLTPFKGRQREDDVYNSSYNFNLSQLRIRIEMAFGRMTAKFQIMRHQMICTLAMQSKVIGAVTQLHNFVIDADGEDVCADQPVRIGPDDGLEENELGRLGIEPLAADVEGNLGFVAVPYETDEVVSSARQRDIVEQLRQKTIRRRVYNLQRNTN
jgi:DDE superfamily endonuclease